MARGDNEQIRGAISDDVSARLDLIEKFAEIGSTNSYLMTQPAPMPGHCRVAMAEHQTAGRGRRDRVWQSPKAAGIYLSVSYTFDKMPQSLPCLTLAIGIGVANALKQQGVSQIQLKWPNDLVVNDGKLGGILTEVQAAQNNSVKVVVGLGLNVDVRGKVHCVDNGIGRIADLREVLGKVADPSRIVASIIENLITVLTRFEAEGFAGFYRQWRGYDWLNGKAVEVNSSNCGHTGTVTGIDETGALLLDTDGETERVVSGTVRLRSVAGHA